MKKVITVKQTGANKWTGKKSWKLNATDIVGITITALTIGWVVFQVVRSC